MEIVMYKPSDRTTVYTIPKGGKISDITETASYLTGIRSARFTFEAAIRTESDYIGCHGISTSTPEYRYRIGERIFESKTPQDILNIYNAIQEQLIEDLGR